MTISPALDRHIGDMQSKACCAEASANSMPRRGLLKAALSAPLAAALTAGSAEAAFALCLADPADTPVMRLFREWAVADEHLNYHTHGMPEDEFTALNDAHGEEARRLVAVPCQNLTDLAAKLMCATLWGQDDIGGNPVGEAVLAEARELIGGAA